MNGAFFGRINLARKRGVVALRYNHPREGPLIGDMDVQTFEGGHVKKMEPGRLSMSTTLQTLFGRCFAEEE
jgi:hypothetical protein